MARELMEEKVYRQIVDDVFKTIDAAFEAVDPDVAESLYSQGTLTIVFHGSRRLILSPQTPVRQIWVAFKDRAWHMDRDPVAGRWLDDRGQGVELYRLVEELTRAEAGLEVKVGA